MADPRNPYAPPNAPVADPAQPVGDGDDVFVPNGQPVGIGRPVAWLGNAWQLFKARPGKWIVAMVLVFVFYMVLSVIPLINFLNVVTWPFIGAGIAMCAESQRRTGDFTLETLAAGTRKAAPLLILAGLFVVLMIFIVAAVFLVIGFGTASQLFTSGTTGVPPELPSGFIGTMVVLGLLMLPISAATYFAPTLIMIHDLDAFTALKMSFIGSLKNILPGILFLILMALLVLVAMIPLLLGLLIAAPVLMISTYTIYRDIFIRSR